MASGTEKAKATVQAFELWMATQTDETYRQLSYRGSLSRSEITKAIGGFDPIDPDTFSRLGL